MERKKDIFEVPQSMLGYIDLLCRLSILSPSSDLIWRGDKASRDFVARSATGTEKALNAIS